MTETTGHSSNYNMQILGRAIFVACYATYKALCRSVGRSVRRSVHRSITLLIFWHLRAVFASLLLPNHMKLMLSCIQDLLLPLPPTLPPLPNRTRRCRFVYPALFILQQWYSTVYISSPQIQLFPTVTKGRIGRPHQSLHKVRMRHLSAEYPRSGYMVGETQVTNRCYFYPPLYSQIC